MKQSMFLKTKKAVLALVLALTLCLGGATTVFGGEAMPEEIPADQFGTAAKPAEAPITKTLRVPPETLLPAELRFDFNIKAVSVDGEAYTAAVTEPDPAPANMPTVGTPVGADPASGVKSLTYRPSDVDGPDGIKGTEDDPVLDEDDGVFNLDKEIGDVLDDVVWPHAGVYEYEISEIKDTYVIADTELEKMHYSPAKYKMLVYVAEDETTGELYAKAVGMTIVTKDTVEQAGTEGVDKISEMVFTNEYLQFETPVEPPVPPNPEDPDTHDLKVDKEVAGDFASKTIDFDYTLKVTKPNLTPADGDTTFIVYKTDASGVQTKLSDGTYGEEYTFTLKHGETLMLQNVIIGSKVELAEGDEAGYTPKVDELIIGGQTLDDVDGTLNTSLAVDPFYLPKANNYAKFLNTRMTDTPTGIIMDNLPFFLLVALAVCGLVAFAVMKGKKKAASRR